MENIKISKPYEGFARTILVEDLLERGFPMPYDILDDLGQAYVLTESNSEIKTQHFEGKLIPPQFFRIASFPQIKKEDLYYNKNIEEKAIQESKEAILRQEDGRLITLLAAAIKDYEQNKDHVITPNHTLELDEITEKDFYKSEAIINHHELEVKNVLTNPDDAIELKWLNDKYNLIVSHTVPVGTTFLLPEKNYLGVLTTLYPVDVQENHDVEQFYKGWVIDELIGLMILNVRGIGLIKHNH